MDKKSLVAHCLSKPGTREDYPFGPDTLALKVLDKVFALTGAEPDAATVNLKCEPDHALILRSVYPDDVKPGYHMNKNHWNTVTINGNVPDDELRDWIGESYDLVVAGMKRADRDKLREMGS